ncbi:hypothetical protein HanIR_Chr13g0659121 [Helianthus annuus]|nr:hypothetical protein HanIR_Chr13g0659121 [Helianthus annuus]
MNKIPPSVVEVSIGDGHARLIAIDFLSRKSERQDEKLPCRFSFSRNSCRVYQIIISICWN